MSDSPGEAERERAAITAMNDEALERAIQETRSVVWGISHQADDAQIASRHLGRLLLERDRRRRSLDRLRHNDESTRELTGE